MASNTSPWWSGFMRKKQIPNENSNTGLERVLTTFHMSLLGVGSTLGLGVYVLTGKIAARSSGPSVVLAFAIAAVASFFSGICYAEFGARVPRAGSAYVYSYVTVGELMAFVIGWNLVLEYVIGAASVARGYSVYIDSLFDGVISSKLREVAPMNYENFSKYPDFLAFSIMILLTIMVIVGVKESTRFNSLFTCVNIVIVLYVVICGSFKANFHNWNLSKDEVPHRPPNVKPGDALEGGEGGFFPFGFAGLMEGASTCFYAFVGFDIIATSAEEAINPTRTIPLSILISLTIVFLAYLGVSGVVTLMWPYYDLLNDAPLPYVFSKVGWPVAKWVVTIGGLFGLSTSLLGAIFPLPRVLYAMARDGLIFEFFAYVHPTLKTPIYSTLFGGALAAVLALVFDIDQLADMMSIGTLMAYSLAAISVVLLRFRDDAEDDEGSRSFRTANNSLDSSLSEALNNNFTAYVWNSDRTRIPNKITASLSTALITLSCVTIFLADLSLYAATKPLKEYALFFFALTGLFATFSVCLLTLLSRQPRSPKKLSFKVPLVPWIPLLSVAINFYLMMNLPFATWKRFGVWMAIGFLIYFGYGYWESTGYMSEEEREKTLLTRKRKRNDAPPDYSECTSAAHSQPDAQSKRNETFDMNISNST